MSTTPEADHDVTVEEIAPRTVLITLRRAHRLNALTWPLINDLHAALDKVHTRTDIDVVIITGEGRGFCAGSDVAGARDRKDLDIPVRFAAQQRTSGLALKLRALPQPVIAAVNGPAVGAGLGLALAADIRIAATSAVFRVGAIRMGLGAGECGISWLLPRLTGTSAALDIMLTNRIVTADEAERRGIVTEVVPDGALLDVAIAKAAQITSHAPFAVRSTKSVFWPNQAGDLAAAVEREDRAQILAVQTHDSRDAMAAFLERRNPTFNNR
ncbi:enoyl-CoA hydratase/isomerase family protein [Frankia sp. Cr2]|uniref:enoyl-CoA hydratase/isomerase family protein n=1 Tax=Frankia sp. Cr2 TaxID=3073932 RepID=UPI002AD2A7FC|nr:enoyl-CoA hydratase/isomerase family protein [Frankia sp. Cr2]